MPRVAASTMLTMRPASNTSRKKMIRLASTLSFHLTLRGRDRAVCRAGIVVVEELVRSGLERSGHDADLSAGDDDLFDVQIAALEFGGRRVLVLHLDTETRARRNRHLIRREAMIPEDQCNYVQGLRKGSACGKCSQQADERS